MPRTPRNLGFILLATLLAVVPLGCGDDDPAGPGGGGATDTIAPLVLDINPGQYSVAVPVDADVVITFSEPMDPATATAAVTVPGRTGLTWNAERTELTVSHAAWNEGTAVTVGVGAGLTDAAGNSLPQAFGATFYTWSAAPALLDVLPSGPVDALPCNGALLLLFSEPMNLTSVHDNVIVDAEVPAKVGLEIRVSAEDGDLRRIRVGFPAPLTPLRRHTLTVGAGTQTAGGTALGVVTGFAFTSAAAADETGPAIVSSVPALDAVAPADLSALQVTFSEPVDPRTLRPTEMSALLEHFLARDPVWNDAGDAMTLYLQGPLPAGVRLFAVFDQNTYSDLVGNRNAQVDSVSFAVAGEPELVPLREDLRLYFHSSGWADDGMARQMIRDVSGTSCRRVVEFWDGAAYTDVRENWRLTAGADGVRLTGLLEDDGAVSFAPALPLLPLPAAAQWSGSAVGTTAEGTFTLAYTAEGEGPLRVRFSDARKGAARAPAMHDYVLEGCRRVSIVYSMTATGQTLPFETGLIELGFAPGLGIFSAYGTGYAYEGETVVDEWDQELWLAGVALDDRYEHPE